MSSNGGGIEGGVQYIRVGVVSRNGGGIEETPWCYTMDPLVRWQHCTIPQCGKLF